MYYDASLIPDQDPSKPGQLIQLGDLFMARHGLRPNREDLDKAISAFEAAVQLIPDSHADKPDCLSDLAYSLLHRFKHFGNMPDIDNSIAARQDIVRLLPDGHPGKPASLNNLGGSLLHRFDRLGNVSDVDKSIAVREDAVRLTPDGHAGKAARLCNLGTSLARRFERFGSLPDLDRSIVAHDDAVRLMPDSHADKPGCLSNLGNSVMNRFERLGNVLDIERSIAAHSEAVKLTVDGHPEKPDRLNNLGNSLRCRFDRLGNVTDIDSSVSTLDDAVRQSPDDHPNKPAFLNNLGGSLLCRFGRLGNMLDINRSISVREVAVRLSPDGHADKHRHLSNLGEPLMRRFERLGNVPDIDRSIGVREEAVRLTLDDHADKPGHLSNLGNSLARRFERLGNVTDLDGSIAAHNNAVRLIPDVHADKPACLNNLGHSLWRRFKHLGNVSDINEAIAVREDAVRLTPDGHAGKPGLLINLGDLFARRFECLGDVGDLDSSTLQFSYAARSSTGPPAGRFNAAVRWAEGNLKIGDSPLEAYGWALDLLPRVSWLGLPVVDRHKELAKIDIVRDAAVAAIKLGQYQTALEWLEQGRSIVWGQFLNLRSPVDALREKEPPLAGRLEQISKDLERASIQDSFIEPGRQLSPEGAARHHRQLATDWDEMVEHVRSVPGFEDFLRPKRLPYLKNAARSGPVVVVNVHKLRCDALVLIANREDVLHVPLEGFSYKQAQELQNSMHGLLSSGSFRIPSHLRDPSRDEFTGNDENFEGILSEIWLDVVEPVLKSIAFPVRRLCGICVNTSDLRVDYAKISQTEDPPRLWWCPTGPLAFLPLHAAGIYNTNEPGSKITDFVTPSYTPTLTALLDKPRPTKVKEFQLLAIAQPLDLPNTARELILIQERAGKLPVIRLTGAEATVGRVIQDMQGCGWIHLACHGTQNTTDPTKSALLLHDGGLELSEIIKTPLPHVEFAFLSACQTATGDRRLSEEAVHLAAGMLLAGYRSVIATTWSIKDYDAPLVADEVYARLLKDHQPDHTQAAYALHHAVRRLRESGGVSFRSWVPFIHVGM